MIARIASALTAAAALSGCPSDECGLPRQDQNPTVFVNANGPDSFCPEVSEGFSLFLDWPYITGDDGGDRVFTFTDADGFDVEEGELSGRDKPTITLIAREDSPAEATIGVYAHNACGESNRGLAPVKVRKERPHAFNPRNPPGALGTPATFTHDGKGYVIGAAPSATVNTTPVRIWDPATRTWSEQGPMFQGGESSAGVLDGVAYLARGIEVESYDIAAGTRHVAPLPGNPFTQPFTNRLHVLVSSGRIFVGPVFRETPVVYELDPVTETFTLVRALPSTGNQACRAAFEHAGTLYYLYENGQIHAYTPASDEVVQFDAPLSASETFVTAFVVESAPWIVTSRAYHTFDPSTRTLTAQQMFNGAVCFDRGWNGPKYATSNFVIGDRVHFVGGQNDATDGPNDFFLGMRF